MLYECFLLPKTILHKIAKLCKHGMGYKRKGRFSHNRILEWGKGIGKIGLPSFGSDGTGRKKNGYHAYARMMPK